MQIITHKCIKRLLAIGATAIGILSPVSAQDDVAHVQNVTIVSDIWMPVTGKAGSAQEGFIIDVAREIFESHKIKSSYSNSVWSRALKQVDQGITNCVAGAALDEVPNFISTTVPFGRTKGVFYTKNALDWQFDGIESLKGHRLGIVSEYDYSLAGINEYVKDPENKHRVVAIPGDNSAPKLMKLLDRGRVDIIIQNQLVGDWNKKKMNLNNIKFSGVTGNEDTLHIACSPKSRTSSHHIVKILDDGILALRRSGKLQTILAKYGLTDWTQ